MITRIPDFLKDPGTSEYIRVRPWHGSDWTFEYMRIDSRVMDHFREILELWESGRSEKAATDLVLLLVGYPEFIDAHHHLAIILFEEGNAREAGRLWRRAAEFGRRAIPETFRWGTHHLPWGILENRPFLRACQGHGLHYLRYGSYALAAKIFEEMLQLNPDDNQGVRESAVRCHFALGQPQEALEVCSLYPDDALAGTLYGRPLALYQLKRHDAAGEALREAAEVLPNVAAELLKKAHRAPNRADSPSVAYGSTAAAHDYWIENGKYWKKAAGALEFAAEVLKKPQR